LPRFHHLDELGECPEWQRGGTVNPLLHGFVGSSPTSPTIRLKTEIGAQFLLLLKAGI
jgi:hypothetical protein